VLKKPKIARAEPEVLLDNGQASACVKVTHYYSAEPSVKKSGQLVPPLPQNQVLSKLCLNTT
jgi:hypothetical protein